MTTLRVWLALVAIVVCFTSAAFAAESPTHAEFDRKITADLMAKSPEAAAVFAEANRARDRADLGAAAAGYTRVLELVPDFVHARRRLCGVESERGNSARAVALCREALAADDSAENHGALALALAMTKGASSALLAEAKDHAEIAAQRKPGESHSWAVLCQVSMARGDVPSLRRCSAKLVEIAPGEPGSHVFAAFAAAADGKTDEAHASLVRARNAGLPQTEFTRLSDLIDDAGTPPLLRMVYKGLRALAAWLAGFGLLLFAGWLLSRAALRAAERVPAEPGGHVRGADARLRKIYRVVLWVCCAYYYASLPIVTVATIVLGGAAILALLAIGHVPIKLFLIVLVVVVVTVIAIVRSLLVRGKDSDPGVRLDLREHPKLDATLDEVAARIGTRRVDNVYFTPGTDVAVTERGGLLKQLRGKSERALILGAGVLEGMTVRELKAILAHEYGHFHNEDTAGGGFSLAVRRSLLVMAIGLAQGGVAAWYNPAWWFVRGFYNVFLRISHGASRLQEVLADRWAAFAYGSAAFESGLRHVIGATVAFDAHADATLAEVVQQKRALPNLYAYAPEQRKDADALQSDVTKALEREPSPYDSHPAPRDRIAWVRKLAADGAPPAADDADSAWSLLSNRESLERSMTGEVRAGVLAAHGVSIPADDASAA